MTFYIRRLKSSHAYTSDPRHQNYLIDVHMWHCMRRCQAQPCRGGASRTGVAAHKSNSIECMTDTLGPLGRAHGNGCSAAAVVPCGVGEGGQVR